MTSLSETRRSIRVEDRARARTILATYGDKVQKIIDLYNQDMGAGGFKARFKVSRDPYEVVHDGILGEVCIYTRETAITLSEAHDHFDPVEQYAALEEMRISDDVTIRPYKRGGKVLMSVAAVLYLPGAPVNDATGPGHRFIGCR